MGNKITRSIKQAELKPRWVIVDASAVRFGKLATKVVSLLMGKDNVKAVDYLPSGDNIIIINASKVEFHQSRLLHKVYPRHSGYPGGYREAKFKEVIVSRPDYVIRKAVWGMLPKNKMGRKLLSNLHIFSGSEHTFAAQKPQKID